MLCERNTCLIWNVLYTAIKLKKTYHNRKYSKNNKKLVINAHESRKISKMRTKWEKKLRSILNELAACLCYLQCRGVLSHLLVQFCI